MRELLKAVLNSKFYSTFLVTLLITLISAIIGLVSGYLWYPDNPIEEEAELVIEKETGFDVDLTPDSPEKFQ